MTNSKPRTYDAKNPWLTINNVSTTSNLQIRRVIAMVDHVNFIDPPINFSFLGLTNPTDALDEVPRIRNTTLKKGERRKFKSSTLHLNNNTISDLTGLPKIISLYFTGVKALQWINLSFNRLTTIPNELLQLENLQILYCHANQIAIFNEISKLQILTNLRNLTLHGNPIEKEKKYRTEVLILLPNLRSLDFSDVTPADSFVAKATGVMNSRIKQRKHNHSRYTE